VDYTLFSAGLCLTCRSLSKLERDASALRWAAPTLSHLLARGEEWRSIGDMLAIVQSATTRVPLDDSAAVLLAVLVEVVNARMLLNGRAFK